MLSAETHWENHDASGEESSGRSLDNRFRTYDPSTGRYVSADPIGQVGGTNTYSYARNSPVGYADPRGLIVGVDDAAAVALAGLAAATAGVYCYYAGCGEALADAIEYFMGAATSAVGAMCMESNEGEDDPPPPPPGPHSEDRKALNDLVNEATNGGRAPMSDADADAALEWADELKIPGARDDRGEDHWIGGDHIHIPGSGIPHIPTGK